MAEILLGVSGGIAAYKSVDVLRILQRRGHGVTVVMTASARRFVGPATFAALSGRPVGTRLFGPEDRAGYDHLELARGHDLLLVVPGVGEHDRPDGRRPRRRAARLRAPRVRRAGADRPRHEHAHVAPPRHGGEPRDAARRAASRSSSPGRACSPTARWAWAGSPTRSTIADAAEARLAGAGSARRPPRARERRGHPRADRPGPLRRQPLERPDGLGGRRRGPPPGRPGHRARLQRRPAAPPGRPLRRRAHRRRPPRGRPRRPSRRATCW